MRVYYANHQDQIRGRVVTSTYVDRVFVNVNLLNFREVEAYIRAQDSRVEVIPVERHDQMLPFIRDDPYCQRVHYLPHQPRGLFLPGLIALVFAACVSLFISIFMVFR